MDIDNRILMFLAQDIAKTVYEIQEAVARRIEQGDYKLDDAFVLMFNTECKNIETSVAKLQEILKKDKSND